MDNVTSPGIEIFKTVLPTELGYGPCEQPYINWQVEYIFVKNGAFSSMQSPLFKLDRILLISKQSRPGPEVWEA